MKYASIAAMAGSALLALALSQPAAAQGVGQLQTKSYQKIGKQKMQVDLTQVDAGELYRELRDHLKSVLEARGNPVGSSGALGAKITVSYSTPIPPPPAGADRGLPSERQTPGLGQSSPIPAERVFTPERRTTTSQRDAQSDRLNPLRINLTVYREQGGAVLWTADANCPVAFADAKSVGRRMVDQMVSRVDASVSVALNCGG